MEHLESLAFKKLSSYVLFHDINYLFLRAQGEGLALLLTMGCILGYNEWWFSFNLEPHCFICSDFSPHMDTWQVQVKKGQHLHDIYIELTNIIYDSNDKLKKKYCHFCWLIKLESVRSLPPEGTG